MHSNINGIQISSCLWSRNYGRISLDYPGSVGGSTFSPSLG